MKKFLLLLSFVLICQNQLSAQKNTVPGPTYNIVVTRDDLFQHTIPGHAHTSVTVDLKIGSTERTNTPFLPDVATSKVYNFPVVFVLSGNSPPTRYAKVTFSNTPPLFSGYYPLTTVVGDHTTIASDPTMIDYTGQFGYGVDITCTGPNQYTISAARFECYRCVPPIGKNTIAGKINTPATALVDNPALGISEIYYTASDKETISVNVVDLHGKTVRSYTTDIPAGLNKLPVDLQNNLSGVYLVKWKSSNGTNGTLKMVKK